MNNRGADQSAQKRRMVWAFIVCESQRQVFFRVDPSYQFLNKFIDIKFHLLLKNGSVLIVMLCSCSNLSRNKSNNFFIPGKEKMSSKTQTTGGVKQFYFNPSTGTYIPIAATTSGTLNTCLKFALKYKVTLPGLYIKALSHYNV